MVNLGKPSRKNFSEVLHRICDNVYYSPPPDLEIKYPCIIYDLADISSLNANNTRYINMTRYTVMAIDLDPDSELVGAIYQLPYSSFSRKYVSDGLNHFVFSIYF